MRKSFVKTAFALFTACAVSLSAVNADTVSYGGKVYGYDEGDIDWGATTRLFYDSHICNHLEIGLRWGYPLLDKPTKYDASLEWGFIGTISELKEQVPWYPYNVVISYNFNEWFALGFAWDSLTVTAHTQHTLDKHNDGEFTTKGPTLTAILTIPDILDNQLVPYGEIGFNYASAKFDANQWWEYGYPSPDEYKALNCPDSLYQGKHRRIDTKADTKFGLVLGIGAKYYLTEHFCLDLSYRHISADAKCHYYFRKAGRKVHDTGITKLPLDYSLFAFGVRYAF